MRRFAASVAVLVGLATLGIGGWMLFSPRTFAEFAGFGFHEHFLHDAGAFQFGLGTVLLLGAVWSDALATALAAFLVGNTVHTVNHVVDLDLGGTPWQAVALGAVSVLLAAALVARWRQLGGVPGTADRPPRDAG